jgi:hypothetical protein
LFIYNLITFNSVVTAAHISKDKGITKNTGNNEVRIKSDSYATEQMFVSINIGI